MTLRWLAIQPLVLFTLAGCALEPRSAAVLARPAQVVPAPTPPAASTAPAASQAVAAPLVPAKADVAPCGLRVTTTPLSVPAYTAGGIPLDDHIHISGCSSDQPPQVGVSSGAGKVRKIGQGHVQYVPPSPDADRHYRIHEDRVHLTVECPHGHKAETDLVVRLTPPTNHITQFQILSPRNGVTTAVECPVSGVIRGFPASGVSLVVVDPHGAEYRQSAPVTVDGDHFSSVAYCGDPVHGRAQPFLIYGVAANGARSASVRVIRAR